MIIAAMQQSAPVIRAGDLVALRSGGPAMTVRACSQNLAYCSWSDGGRMLTGTFDLQTLVLLQPPAGDAAAGAD